MLQIEQKLQAIRPKSVSIVEIPPEENQMDLIANYLRLRMNDGGIYVSTNRPAINLIERLSTYNIDLREALVTNRVCIIDMVSKSVGAKEVKGCIYVSSPSELSATQMAIERAVERIDAKAGRTWLLIDSISTMLVFGPSAALLQFLHFLIGRLRVLQFDCIIFTVEGSVEEKTLSTIKQFCDVVIKI